MSLEFLKEYGALADRGILSAVDRIRQKDGSGSVMVEGMEYALMAGGKRIRPIFCMLGAEIAGLPREQVLDFAAAIEFIHTYSLVHDDLPGMDDDDLRRGQPTCHVKYGEGEAILIGDALLTHGIGLMLEGLEGIPPARTLKAARTMVEAIGVYGMIGGQAADILQERGDREGHASAEAALRYIHRHKTGCLLEASLLSGAILGGLDGEALEGLREYGEAFGLAFQITDDILDLTSTSEELGKPIGSDERNDKLTYPSLYGLERSREMAAFEVQRCRQAAAGYGTPGRHLEALAEYLLERRK